MCQPPELLIRDFHLDSRGMASSGAVTQMNQGASQSLLSCSCEQVQVAFPICRDIAQGNAQRILGKLRVDA